jgi:hypothetical protein
VNADFLLAKTKADIHLIFRLSLWDILVTGVHLLVGFIREKTKAASAAPEPAKSPTKPIKEVAK